MGIILLTELGKTPWQLRFSPFSLLPAVSQQRLPLDMDLPLDTIPVVPSATPTGAPRVSLDTEDTMVVTVMVSTRGRLRLPLDMDPPLDTTLVVASATPTGAPRVSLPTGDMVDTDMVVFTRGLLSLLTTMVEPPPMLLSPALTTTMAMVCGTTRGLMSLLTM